MWEHLCVRALLQILVSHINLLTFLNLLLFSLHKCALFHSHSTPFVRFLFDKSWPLDILYEYEWKRATSTWSSRQCAWATHKNCIDETEDHHKHTHIDRDAAAVFFHVSVLFLMWELMLQLKMKIMMMVVVVVGFSYHAIICYNM